MENRNWCLILYQKIWHLSLSYCTGDTGSVVALHSALLSARVTAYIHRTARPVRNFTLPPTTELGFIRAQKKARHHPAAIITIYIMEHSPFFTEYCAHIRLLHEHLNTRERILLQERRENASIHRSITGFIQETVGAPGITIPEITTLSNLAHLLSLRQEEIRRELHQVVQTQQLFYESSHLPFIPAYSNLDLFNYRAMYLLQISDMQWQVDQYAALIDTVLDTLSNTLPPFSSSSSHTRQQTSDATTNAGNSSPSDPSSPVHDERNGD